MPLRRRGSEPSVNQGDSPPRVFAQDEWYHYPSESDEESEEVEVEDSDEDESDSDATDSSSEHTGRSATSLPMQSSVNSNMRFGEPVDAPRLHVTLPEAAESGNLWPADYVALPPYDDIPQSQHYMAPPPVVFDEFGIPRPEPLIQPEFFRDDGEFRRWDTLPQVSDEPFYTPRSPTPLRPPVVPQPGVYGHHHALRPSVCPYAQRPLPFLPSQSRYPDFFRPSTFLDCFDPQYLVPPRPPYQDQRRHQFPDSGYVPYPDFPQPRYSEQTWRPVPPPYVSDPVWQSYPDPVRRLIPSDIPEQERWHPVPIRPRHPDPSLYDFIRWVPQDVPGPSRQQRDVPGPSHDLPQTFQPPAEDIAGPSGTKPVELPLPGLEGASGSRSFKKTVEARLLQLGQRIVRSIDQTQSVYFDFISDVSALYQEYMREGILLDDVFYLEDWHEMIVSQIMPYTMRWQSQLCDFLESDPPFDIQDWIYAVRQFIHVMCPAD